MSVLKLPPLWLILIIAGLSVLPETVYTPSLPEIARDLIVSESLVEYTLTIYLFAFAVGTLFWGMVSDKHGRKPCMLLGLIIFIVGCMGCYFSEGITLLLISRFIQGFGGSVGSVLGQAICRDSFQGASLGKVYASIGSALAVYPAIGPIIGGSLAQYSGWQTIFLLLMVFALSLSILVVLKLPETHEVVNRRSVSPLALFYKMIRDKKVLVLGFLVAGCNGISFSYFAEGSFYLIDLLGLTPTQYGFTFILNAVATIIGGQVSRRLHDTHSHNRILSYGLSILGFTSVVFLGCIWIFSIYQMSSTLLIVTTIVAQMSFMFGIVMTTSVALSAALTEYKWCIGSASSYYGAYYYILVSLFTLGMGALHNGTLYPMPIYFLIIVFSMIGVRQWLK